MKKGFILFLTKLSVLTFCVAQVVQFFAVKDVHAQAAYVAIRHSRMIINHVADSSNPILILFTPNTVGTEAAVGISFQSGYTPSVTNTNITVSTTGLPANLKGTAINAWPGIGSNASAVSGDNVTFTSSDLSVGTLYGFYITGGITSPATVGEKVSVVSTHTDTSPDFSGYTDKVDKFSTATYIVSDNGGAVDADQVVVSARVIPTYTFTLSANSILLDTAVASVEYPGTSLNSGVNPVTVSATTNANNGHSMWIRSGTSSGLTSSTTATSIAYAGTAADATPTTLSAGTEGFVVDININTNTSGSLTVAAEFNGTGNSQGGTPSTSFQEIAYASGPVDTAGDKVDIFPRVAISGVTLSADDYTQTFTVVGAANI